MTIINRYIIFSSLNIDIIFIEKNHGCAHCFILDGIKNSEKINLSFELEPFYKYLNKNSLFGSYGMNTRKITRVSIAVIN